MLSKRPELFRTIVDIPVSSLPITHTHTIFSIGSCFSEHIANYLNNYLFHVCINPTGILYNPASIAHALNRIITGTLYSSEELFFHENQWKSFDHHSRFNAALSEQCIKNINTSLSHAHTMMQSIDTLIITFGTAFTYKHKDSGRIVANCHRLPHDVFVRFLLPKEEIVAEYSRLFTMLYTMNPQLNIILTISPIRHLRDNPHENQVSKSHLFTAVYELEKRFPALYYFPSYEIVMDELRDYRFYADDMVHPSSLAVAYIWQQFTNACIGKRSRDFISCYAPLLKAQKHSPQHEDSELFEQFKKKYRENIEKIRTKFPEIAIDLKVDNG